MTLIKFSCIFRASVPNSKVFVSHGGDFWSCFLDETSINVSLNQLMVHDGMLIAKMHYRNGTWHKPIAEIHHFNKRATHWSSYEIGLMQYIMYKIAQKVIGFWPRDIGIALKPPAYQTKVKIECSEDLLQLTSIFLGRSITRCFHKKIFIDALEGLVPSLEIGAMMGGDDAWWGVIEPPLVLLGDCKASDVFINNVKSVAHWENFSLMMIDDQLVGWTTFGRPTEKNMVVYDATSPLIHTTLWRWCNLCLRLLTGNLQLVKFP